MNEFTKDELESLIGAFNWIEKYPAYRVVGGWDKELQVKIQSMIDNYCEHEQTEFMRDVGVDKCRKCGVIVE